MIEGGMLTSEEGIVKVKLKVINRKGDMLTPMLNLRNNLTLEDTELETIMDEEGYITLDITELESSTYSLYITFIDDYDDLKLQVLYMFKN